MGATLSSAQGGRARLQSAGLSPALPCATCCAGSPDLPSCCWRDYHVARAAGARAAGPECEGGGGERRPPVQITHHPDLDHLHPPCFAHMHVQIGMPHGCPLSSRQARQGRGGVPFHSCVYMALGPCLDAALGLSPPSGRPGGQATLPAGRAADGCWVRRSPGMYSPLARGGRGRGGGAVAGAGAGSTTAQGNLITGPIAPVLHPPRPLDLPTLRPPRPPRLSGSRRPPPGCRPPGRTCCSCSTTPTGRSGRPPRPSSAMSGAPWPAAASPASPAGCRPRPWSTTAWPCCRPRAPPRPRSA